MPPVMAPVTPFDQQYRIIKDVGAGSSGRVHLIADRKSGAKYVVKCVSLHGADEKTRGRVHSEVKALRLVDHPNVVQFHDSFTAPDEVRIVMEKCEQSLADIIETAKKTKTVINPTVLIEWMTELLCALHHVQSHKIIHRDITASNVFLSAKNHVKLGDFGVCKMRQLDESRALSTTFVGTPNYLAPEILDGQQYDERSDVWSLGVLFYELCSLRPPFAGDNILALTQSISAGTIAPLPMHLDQRFMTVIQSMLKVDPNERTTIQQIFETRFVLPKSHPSHPSHDPERGRAIQRESGPTDLFVRASSLPTPKPSVSKAAQPVAVPAAAVAAAAVPVAAVPAQVAMPAKEKPTSAAPQPASQESPSKGIAKSKLAGSPIKFSQHPRPAVIPLAAVRVHQPGIGDDDSDRASLNNTGVSSLTDSVGSAAAPIAASGQGPRKVSAPAAGDSTATDGRPTKVSTAASSAISSSQGDRIASSGSLVSPTSHGALGAARRTAESSKTISTSGDSFGGAAETAESNRKPSGGAVGSPIPLAPTSKARESAAAANRSPLPVRPNDSRLAGSPSALATVGRLSEEEHRESLNRIRRAGSKIDMAQLRKAMKSKSADRLDTSTDVTFIAVPGGGANSPSPSRSAAPGAAELQTPPRRFADPSNAEAMRVAASPARNASHAAQMPAAAATKPALAQQILALLEQEKSRLSLADMDDISEVINDFKVRVFGLC